MKRIIFIGQAPARPGSQHDVAGTYLRPWLYKIGFDESTITTYFRFHALIDSFPGSSNAGHFRPTAKQVMSYRPTLSKVIQDFKPDILVPVGSMAIAETLALRSMKLTDIIGKSFVENPFSCLPHSIAVIPLPHPSGRSVWAVQHKGLIEKALLLLSTCATQ